MWLILGGLGGSFAQRFQDVQRTEESSFLPRSSESFPSGERFAAITVVRRDGGLKPRDLATIERTRGSRASPNAARDWTQDGIGRCVTDELRRIEPPHGLPAVSPCQWRYMPHIGLGGHGAHRRVHVLGDELARHVLVEPRAQIAHDAPFLIPRRPSAATGGSPTIEVARSW